MKLDVEKSRKKTEIGGDFCEMIPCKNENNGIFPAATKWFLSGRSALIYIIKDAVKRYGIKNVCLPAYCCDSMIMPFLISGLEVDFYPVVKVENGLKSMVKDGYDAILVMDYFGYTDTQDYSHYDGIVIRDFTHSVFSNIHKDATYYFGSVRKWCGVYTGGFAYGDVLDNAKDIYENLCDEKLRDEYIKLRRSAMKLKGDYLAGAVSDKTYLDIYGQAEEIIDDFNNNLLMRGFDEDEAVRFMDVNHVIAKRRENAEILLKEFGDYALYRDIKKEDCPMFVPVLLENRNNIRRILIENEIYCPVHWPVSDVHRVDDMTLKIYENEISLVCDQRYDINDMDRFVSVLKKALKSQ